MMLPRVVSFEEHITLIREKLGDLFESKGDWTKAANILAGIDLESSMRKVDDEFKLKRYIKIAILYLKDDDHSNAEVFIKRAASLIGNCADERIQIQYKVKLLLLIK